MKLTIDFKSDHPVNLPADYNHLIQSCIYHSIGASSSAFLHDGGFAVGGRTFKLFCFSQLMGNAKFNVKTRRLIYGRKVRLVVVSPLKTFMEDLKKNFSRQPAIRIGSNLLTVENMEICEETVAGDSVVIQTLSPVTMYTTREKLNGAKYTKYYEPLNAGYDELMSENLKKKYQAATQAPLAKFLEQEIVQIEPVYEGRLHVLRYKGFIIKGYMGALRLSGPKELLQTALDCGLGGKNAQGFGCIEMKKDRS